MDQKYIHNKTKEIITIITENDGYYILSNNKQIKSDLFIATFTPITNETVVESVQTNTQPQISNELVDPSSFFNSTNLGNVTEQVVNIKNGSGVSESYNNLTTITDRNKNTPNSIAEYEQESAIRADLMKDREREEIAAKYNINTNKSQNTKNPNDDGLDSYLDDEIALNGKNSPNIKNIPQKNIESHKPQINPTNLIFNSFKRIHKVKINLTFDDKIADPMLINLVKTGVEGDIIQYYTDELVDTILSDIDSIKKVIYTQYDILINGEKKKAKLSKPKKKKETTVSNINLEKSVEIKNEDENE